MNYPVIQMDITADKITISQKRFLLNPKSLAHKSDTYKWYVPITYVSKSEAGNADAFNFETRPKYWLSTESGKFRFFIIFMNKKQINLK